MTVRTRFAPSPTGYLHIGGARTALFSWLYARRHGGAFVLRIEDTDAERSSAESVDAILEGMAWLGLDADEGPIFQTDRFDRYREVVGQLLEAGHAYRCWSTPEEVEAMREAARARGDKPKYDGTWRDRADAGPAGVEPAVRFRNPEGGEVVWSDAVKGEIRIANSELDDLVILRADGTPTYNLTVVVDDADMGITHVIRGDDHVNNTPRQVNLLRAMGVEPPVYAHLPMILGEDGRRMSKRHGAVSVVQYRDDGYLPEALLNYLVRLGWSHGDDEFFTVDEMTALFSLEAVNRSGSVFDTKKLDSVSRHWMHALPAGRLAEALRPHLVARGIDPDAPDGPALEAVADSLRERADTLVQMADGASWYWRAPAEYDPKAAAKQFTPAAADVLEAARKRLAALDEWSPDAVQAALQGTVDALGVGFGKLGQPLRLAVTGTTASPGMNVVLSILGRDETFERVARAVARCRVDGGPDARPDDGGRDG